MINARAYSTLQYEVGSIADSAITITPGTALKISKMPISPITKVSDQYYNVSVASSGDEVNGVVALSGNISDSVAGRMVLLNSGFIPVLLADTFKKGDHLKPTIGGKWTKGMTGDQVFVELMEDGAKDSLAWGRPDIETL